MTKELHEVQSLTSYSCQSQEIVCVLWNPKIRSRVYNSLSIQRQISPVQALPSHFLKIHFNIIHPSPPRSSSVQSQVPSISGRSPISPQTQRRAVPWWQGPSCNEQCLDARKAICWLAVRLDVGMANCFVCFNDMRLKTLLGLRKGCNTTADWLHS